MTRKSKRVTQRRVFKLADLIEGVEYATPMGRVYFTPRGENVSVNINNTFYPIYGGAEHTLGFVNKRLADIVECYGELECR